MKKQRLSNMISYDIYNQNAETVGKAELSEKVFGQKANDALVHQVAVTQMANERTVLAHTKDRSEVRGGGKKPWRQKGTGRARVGSSRSPLWKGGGVTFGPTKDRNFSKKINEKMRRKAVCVVLSDKVSDKRLAILDELAVSEYKTKTFKTIVDKLVEKALPKEGKISLLFVDAKPAVTSRASAKNLPGIKLIDVDNLNTVDALNYKNIVITKKALETIEERYK